MSQDKNDFEAKKILLDWLIHWQIMSMPSIKYHCADFLSKSYFKMDDVSKAFFHVFTPLYRMGLIEFAGNDRYYVPPPICITDHKTQRSLLFRAEHLTDTFLINNVVQIEPYLHVAVGEINLYEDRFLENGYKSYYIKPELILSNFPPIDVLISNFQDANLTSSPKLYQYLKNSGWGNENGVNPYGIARKTIDDQNRYFVYPSGIIKEIPDRKLNPEAFFLSYSFQTMLEKKSLYYNNKTEELFIPSFSCPTQIFRVLFINMLLNGEKLHYDSHLKFTKVSKCLFREINRIFNNSIIER